MLTLRVRVGFNVVYQYPGMSRTTIIALSAEVSIAYSIRRRYTVVEVADLANFTVLPVTQGRCVKLGSSIYH
jgi:hypothetical protein